jgi:predicted XRE-type DNA-binding protein
MRGVEGHLFGEQKIMNAKKEIATPPTGTLEEYLAGAPGLTTDDLEALRVAAEKLETDPAFQADYLKSRFVEKMLAAMEEDQISQSELANRWGKTRQYLSKLLNEDHRINFTIETMCEFAQLLNRRVDLQVVRPSEVTHVIRAVRNPEAQGRKKPKAAVAR